MKTQLKNIAEQICNELAFAIDNQNRDAEYDDVFVDDDELHFANERGAYDWYVAFPLEQEVEITNGLLKGLNNENEWTELQLFEAKPMKIEL